MAVIPISNTLTTGRTLAALGVASLLIALGCSPATPPEPQEETAAETVPAEPPAPLLEWQKHIEEVHPTIEAWAKAWSDQDVDAYLSHYSVDFRIPNNLSREAWENQRRQRLTAPSEIAVTLSDLQTVGFKKAWIGGKQHELVKVRFRQSYQSNTFGDEVDKELEVEWIDPEWKILIETSL